MDIIKLVSNRGIMIKNPNKDIRVNMKDVNDVFKHLHHKTHYQYSSYGGIIASMYYKIQHFTHKNDG